MSYKPDRRRVLIGAAALAAPMIGHRRARAAEQIYIGSPGGEYDEIMKRAIDDPFTKATGIQVTRVGVSNGKILAMVRAKDLEIDIADLSSTAVLTLERLGALAPIDYDKWQFAKKSDIAPGLLLTHGAPIYNLAHCMVYNTKAFPAGKRPKTWADAWDVERFPGPRAFPDMAFSQAHFEFALRADGVPKDKLYPLDLDRAFKSLDKIKPHIKVWWTQGNQSEQLIRDGEVDMIGMWNARAQVQMNQGVPLQMVWNEAQNSCGYWCVPKGTPRKKAAFKFMEFVIQPVGEAKFCEQLFYGPSNPASLQYLPKDVLALSPSTPEHEKAAFRLDAEWFGPRSAQIKERWAQWMAS